MYNIFNVRRNEWEIGRLNLRDAATERRTTIPYREEISHSAMSGSFSFVDQILFLHLPVDRYPLPCIMSLTLDVTSGKLEG